MGHRWTVRVLGPVDVLTPYGEVTVGGERLQAVLGALVISVGHAVPVDRLIDIVWGDAPPRTADGTVQSYVSRLRHVLGPSAIARIDHAYELVADVEQVDAVMFEALAAEAMDAADDPAKRRALARRALRLWRGVPFGDLADRDPFRLEALRLDEMRMTVMELDLRAGLDLGRGELLVGQLEAAVAEYPYRERLWYLLIEALAGDGRRVDALRACTRLRELLAGVGLEGGPQLRRLEQLIARGEFRRNGSSPSDAAAER